MVNDALEVAIGGDLNAMKEMIARNPGVVNATDEYGFTLLHCLAEEEQWEIVRLLIAQGADVNARNHEGVTPLHITGWPEMVDILLDNGANINAQDNDGSTPLHILSAESDRLEVIERLLERGADPTIKNNWGQTATDIARSREDQETMNLLEQSINGRWSSAL